MGGTDKRKQSLYFPDDMLNEIMTEAVRLDRSISWVVQRAWRIASHEVGKFGSNYAGAAAQGAPQFLVAPQAQPTVVTSDREPGSQVREFLVGKFEKL